MKHLYNYPPRMQTDVDPYLFRRGPKDSPGEELSNAMQARLSATWLRSNVLWFRIFALLLLVFTSGSFFVPSASAADATVIVTANPLWTDTGITLTPSSQAVIHDAVGSWSWEA